MFDEMYKIYIRFHVHSPGLHTTIGMFLALRGPTKSVSNLLRDFLSFRSDHMVNVSTRQRFVPLSCRESGIRPRRFETVVRGSFRTTMQSDDSLKEDEIHQFLDAIPSILPDTPKDW
jgi:hypothetical protein